MKAASANRIYAKQINGKPFIKKTYKIFLGGSGLLYNSGSVPYNEAYVITADRPYRKRCGEWRNASYEIAEIGEYDDN